LKQKKRNSTQPKTNSRLPLPAERFPSKNALRQKASGLGSLLPNVLDVWHILLLCAPLAWFSMSRMVKVGGFFGAKNAYQNSESSGETHSFGDSKTEPS